MKNFFKSENGEFHFGGASIEGFSSTEREEFEKALENLNGRKLWRCHVCNDLYIGEKPPEKCPTCMAIEAYVEINKEEGMEMIK